jgi:hypothetical protein
MATMNAAPSNRFAVFGHIFHAVHCFKFSGFVVSSGSRKFGQPPAVSRMLIRGNDIDHKRHTRVVPWELPSLSSLLVMGSFPTFYHPQGRGITNSNRAFPLLDTRFVTERKM